MKDEKKSSKKKEKKALTDEDVAKDAADPKLKTDELPTNPEAEQELKEAGERTKEEKSKQHLKNYGGNVEKEKETERSKEEKESKSSESSRTPEEKQKQYEEAYGMGERKQAEAELQRKSPLIIRDSLVNFVMEQEMLLRIHDELKGADGWLDGHPLILTAKLMEEVGELAEAVLTSKAPAIIRREAADVGNLAMMIAHKSGQL